MSSGIATSVLMLLTWYSQKPPSVVKALARAFGLDPKQLYTMLGFMDPDKADAPPAPGVWPFFFGAAGSSAGPAAPVPAAAKAAIARREAARIATKSLVIVVLLSTKRL